MSAVEYNLLMTFCALCGVVISWIYGHRVGTKHGIRIGRDEQWTDDLIAAGQRERERRDRLGRFKGKPSP